MKKSSRLYKLLPKDTEGNLDQSSYQYIEVPAMGSNFQNGIGFMFGPRDTYAEVRENITNKGSIAFGQDIDMLGVNQDIALDTALDNMEFDRKNSLPAQALGMESANVSATEDSVDFQIDSSKPPVNIAQVNANTFLESLATPIEQANIKTESEGVVVAEDNMPKLTPKQDEQLDLFEAALEDKYPLYNGIL